MIRKLFAKLILFSLLILTLGISADNVPGSSRKILPISVGDRLPSLVLTDTDHQTVKVQSYLEDQPLILIYYRGGW